MDWAKSDWFHTPVTSHADLTALDRLAPTRLSLSARPLPAAAGDAGQKAALVRVKNAGSALAFQVRLRVVRGNDELLPVLWEDNYLALLPGETRELRVSYPAAGDVKTRVTAEAWNGPAASAEIP